VLAGVILDMFGTLLSVLRGWVGAVYSRRGIPRSGKKIFNVVELRDRERSSMEKKWEAEIVFRGRPKGINNDDTLWQMGRCPACYTLAKDTEKIRVSYNTNRLFRWMWWCDKCDGCRQDNPETS